MFKAAYFLKIVAIFAKLTLKSIFFGFLDGGDVAATVISLSNQVIGYTSRPID